MTSLEKYEASHREGARNLMESSQPYIDNAIQAVESKLGAVFLPDETLARRNYLPEEFDNHEFGLTSQENFEQLWNICFGETGYMNILGPVDLERAKAQIAQAYVLAEYGHFTQTRDSGGPYVSHVIEVATLLAKDEQDAGVIAAGLLHDIWEDSRDTQRPVELPDIAKIFKFIGPESIVLTNRVDALSKARGQVKSLVFADSVKRLVELGIEDPAVILIKIYDRLHNMRTIEWKPKYKQERRAWETIGIFAPLAYYLGYFDEYHELMDISSKVILLGERKVGLVDTIQANLDVKAEKFSTEWISGLPKGVSLAKKRPSHFHEIADYVSTREHRPGTNNTDSPTTKHRTIHLVVEDDLVPSPYLYAKKLAAIELSLLYRRRFITSPYQNTEIKNQLTSPGGMDYPITQYYSRIEDGVMILYRVNISKRSLYYEQRVRMARKTQVRDQVLTEEESDLLSKRKKQLAKLFAALEKGNANQLDLVWGLGSAFKQPMMITLSEENSPDNTFIRPMKTDSTLIDVLLMGHDKWMHVASVRVNGKIVAWNEFNQIIHSGDVVQIVLDPNNLFIHPDWYFAINKALNYCEDQFLDGLNQYWLSLPEGKQKQRIEKRIKYIGRKRIERELGDKILVGIERICALEPESTLNPKTILLDVGCGTVKEDDFYRLVHAIADLQDRLVNFRQFVTSDTPQAVEKENKRLKKMYLKVLQETQEKGSTIVLTEKGKPAKGYRLDKVTIKQGWNSILSRYQIVTGYDPFSPAFPFVEEAYRRLAEIDK